ncbi:probable G-protein coupled receptor 34 [Girardinichthys multiradiatus]|uniref:probable G-protein coupled receptor 34 n=1 Tax=Girardinichthys multiradiatus TaxID=208333 RepID=UPI001FAC207B|nr:probable G-protein coupled receptor 34 [Girardinichthys multiradiatus]
MHQSEHTMTTLLLAADSIPPNASSSTSSPSTSVSMASFLSSISPSSSSITTSVAQNQTNCMLDNASLRLPLAVSYSLFFVLGLVGNLFALWVFLFVHSRRNSVRVFLINCAVADLVLLACLPFRVFYHLKGDQWVLGSLVCKLVGNAFYMNMYISITLLGLISLDRYVRLRGNGRARRSIWGRLRGHKQLWSWVVCGALWSLFLMGTIVMITTKEDKENKDQCFQYKQRQAVSWKAYINAALVLLFWVVFVMLVASYVKIASQLLQLSQNKPDLPNALKYKNTAKKSFFVLFLFTICFAPYHAFRPVYILSQLSSNMTCNHIQMVDRTNEIMLLLSTFNSCLDPIMYFLLSGSVRGTVLQVLGHRFGHRLPFFQDGTLNSSTMEYRRGSTPILPDQLLNKPSLTPRTSFCVNNSPFRRTGATTPPLTGHR